LEDEDIANEIRLHCMHISKYVTAAHLVDFLNNPDVRERLNLQKTITVHTAEHWMHRPGYKWGKEPKGQYFEGHERKDVVAYRQTKYIPTWKTYKSRMAKYTYNGLELNPNWSLELQVGVKQVIVWFHDKSTFYVHNHQLVRWVFIGDHPTPFQKGEGSSIMVANYVSAEKGWLLGKDG
ncbi:hypothetical protein BDV93DRAFT_461689, partial [Ceratobasidium sp. AG-I]